MAKSQIDLMPIALAAGVALAWKMGLLDPVLKLFGLPVGTKPPAGVTCPTGQHYDAALAKCVADTVPPPSGLTEDQAALIVIRNQPGLCETMRSMSNGFYNCDTDLNKIALVKQWFYHTNPQMEPTYHNLPTYVQQMRWS